jgi:hypothetical protein
MGRRTDEISLMTICARMDERGRNAQTNGDLILMDDELDVRTD